MGDITKDSRFTKLINDPSYRQIPSSERKVKIDKRFQSMFDNEKFKVKYTIDKRGKPINQTSSENLKKYYDLSSEESDSEDDEDGEEIARVSSPAEEVGKFVRPIETEDDKNEEEVVKNDKLELGNIERDVKKKLRDLETDYARGEGVLFSDSSSEEEESDKEDDDLEHGWGELDADAETCEEATDRLAVCNMDWDNIKASDLYVLFNSFLPPGGSIKSVTIYPSEFGLKRMQEEEIRGPIELTEKKVGDDSGNDSNDEENEEGSKYHMEKLRKYQLNRLKYYYAVVVFDSAATSNKIYTECDGIEYESSASKLDLRFVPENEVFDQEIHEECTEAPEVGRYKPRLFTTTALQQAKVQLTWDSANPHRMEILKNAADGNVDNEDLKNYLACSSSEEEDADDSENEEKLSDVEDEKVDKLDPISKYKSLLSDIENVEKDKKNRNMEMEITWGLGLKEKTQELVKKKIDKVEKLTPFEEMIEKQREKKKARKLEKKKSKVSKDDDEQNEYSSDDIPSDVDMNDSYFAEEFKGSDFKQKKKKTVRHENDETNEEDDRKRAELELLLDDDDMEKSHFSLKKIQESESDKKSKKKGKYKNKKVEVKSTLPDFNVDVNDDRFSALFTSHHYNIDPTDPNYKKTKGMEALIHEKLKRRPTEDDYDQTQVISKKSKRDAAVSVLVNNIKRKTEHLKK